MKLWQVAGDTGLLHRLPRKRSVTSGLHPVLLESDLYGDGGEDAEMCQASRGVLGKGRGLPGGACHFQIQVRQVPSFRLHRDSRPCLLWLPSGL